MAYVWLPLTFRRGAQGETLVGQVESISVDVVELIKLFFAEASWRRQIRGAFRTYTAPQIRLCGDVTPEY